VAIKQGIIVTNPVDGAELPRVEQHEITPLTDEDIPLFLSAIDNSPMRNAYALCLFAGLREGECLGLSWGQVDFEKGRITISQQLQKEKNKNAKYYIAQYTKSDRPHDLRHTAATVAFAAGSDPKSVHGMLGHATAAFTLDRYGHVTERMMKDTANRMQNYYDGLSKMG